MGKFDTGKTVIETLQMIFQTEETTMIDGYYFVNPIGENESAVKR